MDESNKNLDEILDERSEYGDYSLMSNRIAQISTSIRHSIGYPEMPPSQQHALDMIAVKIGRLVTGRSDKIDTWRDIAGYATLVAQTLEQEQKTRPEGLEAESG